MKTVLSVLLAMLAFSAGCGKNPADDQAAIRAAIEKHLSGRSNLNREAMTVEVKQVSIQGNMAQAQVEFRAKSAEASSFGMQMSYTLEREGATWVVRGSRPAGDNSMHPSPGTPAMPAGNLPPGHPPVGGASQPPAKKP